MPRLEQLKALLEKDPTDAFLNFGLAMEYAKEGRDEQALAQFDRVLELDPNYIAALHQKANVQLRLNHTADAIATLDEAIATAQRTGDAHAVEELQALRESLV